MGSVLVVVAHVFAQESLQLPFIEHDHMVQQVAAADSYPALCGSISCKVELFQKATDATLRVSLSSVKTWQYVAGRIPLPSANRSN